MNQCIKELLLKVVPMEGEDGDLLPSLHTQQDIEKFAELIVRECINVCENGWAGEFTICGIRQCVEDLKKHFGVEWC